jgi:hypothetical protein
MYIAPPSIQEKGSNIAVLCDKWVWFGTKKRSLWTYCIILFLRLSLSSHLGYLFYQRSLLFFTESVADFLLSKLYLWRISLNGVVNVDEHQEEGHQHCHPEDARKDDI